MVIDLDVLDESQLIDLNRRIVERIKFLRQAKAHAGMLRFAIGEPVSFPSRNGETVYGVLTRYNKKTVTILATCGHLWNVPPHILKSERIDGPAEVRTPAALPPAKG